MPAFFKLHKGAYQALGHAYFGSGFGGYGHYALARGVGDCLRGVLAGDMPYYLPPEPLFDLSCASPSVLNSTLRRASCLMFVFIAADKGKEAAYMRRFIGEEDTLALSEEKEGVLWQFYRDVYARSQRVAVVQAVDTTALKASIALHGARLLRYFESQQAAYIEKSLRTRSALALRDSIRSRHGIDLLFPKEYVLAKEVAADADKSEGFVWLRHWEEKEERNIVIYHRPYTDTLIWGEALAFREDIMRRYVHDGEKPHLYVTHQSELPVERAYLEGDTYGLGLRGLWKLTDNSIGGPFVSHMRLNRQGDRVYYVEAFLYSPGQKKRDKMRELRAILEGISYP